MIPIWLAFRRGPPKEFEFFNQMTCSTQGLGINFGLGLDRRSRHPPVVLTFTLFEVASPHTALPPYRHQRCLKFRPNL